MTDARLCQINFSQITYSYRKNNKKHLKVKSTRKKELVPFLIRNGHPPTPDHMQAFSYLTCTTPICKSQYKSRKSGEGKEAERIASLLLCF